MIYFARWKIMMILGVCALGVLFVAPNFLSIKQAESLPSWLPHKQLSLGLDLQGGSHLLLEVKVDSVLKETLEALIDTMRTTLRKARIRYSNLGIDGLAANVTIKDIADEEQALQLLKSLDSSLSVDFLGSGNIRLEMTEKTIRDRRTAAIEQSIEIVRRRIDETGVREPTIQRQGQVRILVQLPGIDDPERVKRLLGKTAKLSFHLVDERQEPSVAGRVPPGSILLPSNDEVGSDGRPRMYMLKKRVMISGDTLADSQATFQDNQPVVSFRFDTIGGKRFGKATTENVGKLFAIVLDNKVISAPVIREPILGGSGVISGRFSVQAAQDLSLLLRAGALPAPLTILEERSVGPGLGADSIAAGKTASMVGMAMVIAFMIVTYGRFGLMADVALIANIILIGAALSLLQATLTLPGIAGIVLTIGMAVDANVLVFERIREEMRAGRTPISSIDAGYSRAITTIIDANVTTLIAAVLLYQFGSGPVRGFAVTLAIGIVTSLFTAIMLTRLMVATWLKKTRPDSLPI
jgi:preprotein translocase subunit SecD